MFVKLLTDHHLEILSHKEGSTGSSESTLVKIPHCWKSHATAHIVYVCTKLNQRTNSLVNVHLIIGLKHNEQF